MIEQWPLVKLGTVILEEREPVGSSDGDGLPVLGVTNIQGVTQTGVEASADRSKYLRLRPGRFVYNPYRINVGSIGLSSGTQDGICSPAYVVFTPIERIDADFLRFFLKSAHGSQLINFHGNRGSVRSALRFDDLCKIEIPLPSLSEQRRIVARIEELSAKIEEARTLRRQAVEETAKIMASFLMHLFDNAQAEQQSQVRLGEICLFQGGSQPPKLQFAYEPRKGYVRLIQIRDYKSDDYLTYVPKDSVRKFCSKDDVMIGRYGPPIFQILRGIEGAYNVALMKATPDESRLSKDFLFYLLQEPRLFQKVEEDSQRSSGQTGVRKELLEEHMTFVPPLPEQRRIVAELDTLQTELDKLKRLQAETAAEMDALLPSILDKAFKGEL